MKQLRVALVGCGIISGAHIGAYKKHADRARITVCCDLDVEKARKAAEEVGGAEEAPRATARYEDALADPDVDAVEIVTPHHLHCEQVVAAANAGKHILCQKPLGKTLAECDTMIAAASRAGVTLFYGEINRTTPAAGVIRDAIAQGRIGRLIGIQAVAAYWQGGEILSTAWRYDPKIAGGGQLLDGGIHSIDLMLSIGGPIEAVTCCTNRFRPELGGEDTAVVNARFAGGHLGTLFASQACGIGFPGPSFAAMGLEGVITLGGPYRAVALHRTDLPERREVLLEKWGDSFEAMIGRYLDTVLDGAQSPSPPEVGRDDLAVVLAAYESARTGREARVCPARTPPPPSPLPR